MFLPYKKLVNRALILSLRNLSTTKALMKNHYDILEVSRNATQAEIKNAFFRLTKMYHPDKIAATDENLRKFREISEAYEVLGNEHSRKLYDTGFLGDVKRVGTEDTDTVDPIISFYKQRQDMAKVLQTKSDGVGIWMQSSFTEAKKKKQHDLFSMKTTGGISIDPFFENIYVLGYLMVISFLFFLNFEHTRASELWKDFMKLVKF